MMPSRPRKSHESRKGDVPSKFILKWQSSGPKPQVRRPTTACQPCRTAKVKCNGQPQCDRCNTRDLACKYTNSSVPEPPPPSNPSSTTNAASPIGPTQTPSEEITINLEPANVTNLLSMDSTGCDDAFEPMADWSPDAAHHALDDFAWPPMDTNFTVGYSSDVLSRYISDANTYAKGPKPDNSYSTIPHKFWQCHYHGPHQRPVTIKPAILTPKMSVPRESGNSCPQSQHRHGSQAAQRGF
jgi:hypothetical protein